MSWRIETVAECFAHCLKARKVSSLCAGGKIPALQIHLCTVWGSFFRRLGISVPATGGQRFSGFDSKVKGFETEDHRRSHVFSNKQQPFWVPMDAPFSTPGGPAFLCVIPEDWGGCVSDACRLYGGCLEISGNYRLQSCNTLKREECSLGTSWIKFTQPRHSWQKISALYHFALLVQGFRHVTSTYWLIWEVSCILQGC